MPTVHAETANYQEKMLIAECDVPAECALLTRMHVPKVCW